MSSNLYNVTPSIPSNMDDHQKQLFRIKLRAWYAHAHRRLPWRETADPYKIWISEVMLQQTQVATVIDYFSRFIERFPNILSLAKAEQQDVLKLWEGLGYYSRARNIHRAARQLYESGKPIVPDAPQQFKQLPGVGDYIGAAVMSIAFKRPLAVVDGNVKRVLARLFQIDLPVNQSGTNREFQKIAQSLLDHDHPSTFNQGMMELGALICKPKNPLCHDCPMSQWCKAYENDRVDQYPRRLAKKSVPRYQLVMGAIIRNGKFLIIRRQSDGFLGGLWELPGGRLEKQETIEDACLQHLKTVVNLTVDIDRHIVQVRHAYTHFRIMLDLFLCRPRKGRVYLRGPQAFRWIHLNQIPDFPFHKAIHKCMPALHDALS